MALTAARTYEVSGRSSMNNVKTAGNDTYYMGAMLCADTNGYAAVPSDASTAMPLGVYTGRQGQAFAVASGDHDEVELEVGKIWIPFTGAAQSDVGELFYISDDGTLTQTASAKVWALRCIGFKTGYVLVDFANLIHIPVS